LCLVCPRPEIRREKIYVSSDGRIIDITETAKPTEATNFRGIGDILLPYYLLESLDIRWRILDNKDPRIKVMEDCANAPPVMRADNIRFSRPCMMSTVVNLHIDLGNSGHVSNPPELQREAIQLDLILQQFDLPALRNFHLSHQTNLPVESLLQHWSGILPGIHVHHWPCLQTVQICFTASHGFRSSTDGRAMLWVSLQTPCLQAEPLPD
jgi:hypothetical protein